MPKIVDAKQRRGEISDVVLEIIAEVGIDGVTIRDVATRSGWSTGVIHHYIGGRDAILHAALKRATWKSGLRFHEVQAREDLSAFERLEEVLKLNLPLDKESSALVRIYQFFYAEVAAKGTLAPVFKRYLDTWRKNVRVGVADVLIERGLDISSANEIGDLLVAIADGFAFHESVIRGSDYAEDIAKVPGVDIWIETALTLANPGSVTTSA